MRLNAQRTGAARLEATPDGFRPAGFFVASEGSTCAFAVTDASPNAARRKSLAAAAATGRLERRMMMPSNEKHPGRVARAVIPRLHVSVAAARPARQTLKLRRPQALRKEEEHRHGRSSRRC